ncbi:hypothetical protein IE53DRAFT_364125 [Violaceomyces palustris]|uniref:Uncharacterized protein n=1 Tax=Violaceomyces palustris TaxID=1673888 RepID=A0ACD0NQM8_9BASI|nr:hypothetical protein IE53DRAFT_364125 [Violaceomyces palustris]
MGLSIDHLDPEEYPTDLNVKDLTKEQQTQLFNYKLTEVDVRNEYEDRRTICDNPFSRQVLKQMANNEDLVRKPEAKMIYELIGNNVELWYNFSNTGKIPLTLVDNRLLSKYNLVSKNYPFIQRKDLTLRH